MHVHCKTGAYLVEETIRLTALLSRVHIDETYLGDATTGCTLELKCSISGSRYHTYRKVYMPMQRLWVDRMVSRTVLNKSRHGTGPLIVFVYLCLYLPFGARSE